MDLNLYLKPFDAAQRDAFAVSVGTTVGHLNNVRYKQRTPSAALTRAIAKETGGLVPEWDLRPDDWWLIWDHLIGAPSAPAVPVDGAAAPTQETRDAA